MPDTPDEAPETDPDGAGDEGRFEALLAECIQAIGAGRPDRVDELCAEQPHWREALLERLASLRRLGLLDAGGRVDLPAEATQRFGRYSVLRQLGRGGMSVVYLVRDDRLGRRVALKTSPALALGDERVRARFEREIQAIAQLEHPGVVKVLDVGEEQGQAFFTMEYVEGATLAELLEKLRERGLRAEQVSGTLVRELLEELAPDEGREGQRALATHAWPTSWFELVCRWMLEVAGALAHAHAAGILHRDVKPGNVIVGRDGRARLFDLGLARLEGSPGITHTGDFTGTPYYVAPEQLLRGVGEVDERSDVFALGVTLYELLTLRRPFTGDSTAQVFQCIVDRDPTPPRKLASGLPKDLETACLTALEKQPAARYQRMEDLAEDLRRFLELRPVRARSRTALERGLRFVQRKPAVAAAAVLAAVVAIGLPVGLFWANRAMAVQRDLARDNAASALRIAGLKDRVASFLADLFALEPEEARGGDAVTAREILDRGARRLPTGFEDEPLVQASLMRAHGRVYHNLGLAKEALPLLDRAFATIQRELGETHVETAGLLHELGRVHLALDAPGTSFELCRRALDAFDALGLGAEEEALMCRVTLARAAREPQELAQARNALLAALTDEGVGRIESDAQRASLLHALGGIELSVGGTAAAESAFEQALVLRQSAWVPDSRAIAATMDELASLRRARGADAQALALERARETLRTPSTSAGPRDAVAFEELFRLRPAWRDAYDRSFQDGITALQTGRYEQAEKAFHRCLELQPTQPVCAYNLACGATLQGELEHALDWMERAVALGFGCLEFGLDVMEKDPDLAPLRARSEWPALFERARERRASAQRYSRSPAVQRAKASDIEPVLLVVLHANGSSKDDVIAGPWGRAAEALGWTLLAPSAAIPLGADPREGMYWFRDVEDYLARPWVYDEPLTETIGAHCKEAELRGGRVILVGEGHGCLLAANLAFTAPGLFAGALLVNGPFVPRLAGDRTFTAAGLDLALEVVLDAREPLSALPTERPLGSLAADLERAVEPWGLTESLRVTVVEAPPQAESDAAAPTKAGHDAVGIRVRALEALQARSSAKR